MCEPSAFVALFREISQRAPEVSFSTEARPFRALFGVSAQVCAVIWGMLRGHVPRRSTPTHLLWSLMFLKVYASEHVHCEISGANEKTFRKWVWVFVPLLADLSVVSDILRHIRGKQSAITSQNLLTIFEYS